MRILVECCVMTRALLFVTVANFSIAMKARSIADHTCERSFERTCIDACDSTIRLTVSRNSLTVDCIVETRSDSIAISGGVDIGFGRLIDFARVYRNAGQRKTPAVKLAGVKRTALRAALRSAIGVRSPH
ncbi:hypothetical protein Axy18_035 [Achromobacter phage vB_AxyS_19-32_Axy18]|nr:hypothetical protein Axy18_035 [Achromobacter phage vB_AxyS_19-32_Axy18]